MNSLDQFKNDLWNGIYFHAKKMIVPSIGVTIIYLGLMTALVVGIFMSFFDMEMLRELSSMSNSFDPMAMRERNEFIMGLFENINPGMIAGAILLFYAAILLIGSWFMNVMLTMSEDIVLTDRASLGDAIKSSFNKNMIRLFGLFVVFMILAIFLTVASAALVKINIGLAFIGMLLSAVIAFRLTAAPGAIVHGKMGVPAALSFSWNHIDFKRSFKTLVVLMVFGIIMLLVTILMASIFSLIGGIGGILSVVFQIALSVIVYALMFAALSAVFFRYADVAIEGDESEHLVDTDTL